MWVSYNAIISSEAMNLALLVANYGQTLTAVQIAALHQLTQLERLRYSAELLCVFLRPNVVFKVYGWQTFRERWHVGSDAYNPTH